MDHDDHQHGENCSHGTHADAPTCETSPAEAAPPPKVLSPAAQRALAEAAERRAQANMRNGESSKEYNGPQGPEPTRYGDWERKGIASDF